VSQYSWSSPTQLVSSENKFKCKKKMSHKAFYFTRNSTQQGKISNCTNRNFSSRQNYSKKFQLIGTYGLGFKAGQSSGQNYEFE
jgi:hypothetical protein